MVACVVLPVISVVGGRLARCTRCTAFCSAMAAMPAKPVSSAAGLSGSGNGPNETASAKNANRERDLGREQDAHDRQAARAQRGAGQPRQRDHQDEFRQRQDLADDAVGAEHQSGAERDEVSGDVRGEQALQAEEAGGVDEAAVERQQRRDRRRSAGEFSYGAARRLSPCP